jgi:hypothetical protein
LTGKAIQRGKGGVDDFDDAGCPNNGNGCTELFAASIPGVLPSLNATWTTTPGDVGAWHYHPGYVHNVVTAGAMKIEDGCGGSSTFSAGQAFETSEGRVHRAINEGAVDATEFNVFIREEGKPLTRFIPGNERRCGPPSTVNECQDGGWMQFNFPDAFPNQGSCIEYVLKRPKVNLLVPQDPLQ